MRSAEAAIALLAVAASAGEAADFRGLRPGESCAGIAARESTLGSRPLNAGDATGGIYLFAGQETGHAVTITYWCRDDLLIRGGYLFAQLPRPEAFALYEQWRRRLEDELGKAAYDIASPEHQAKMREFDVPVAETDRHSAYWRAPGLEIHLSRYAIASDGSWDVSVLFLPPRR